ncbi:MAG: MFS transporter [Gammaproteobacteria bacterium]|nr:MFS transporter [Gammaproteobacteria bacterium]
MSSRDREADGGIALKLCMGWGLGSAGMATMNLSRALMLRYMTDFLEVAAVTAGLLFAMSKIFDAATDPLMGAVLDRTGTTARARSMYVLLGALFCPLAYLMIFNVPAVVTTQLMPWYLLATLLLFAVAYTFFSVPYLTMPVDITRDYHQRNYLLSYRAMGIAVGGLVGGLLAPLLVARFGRTRDAHEIMSLAVAGMIFLFLLTCYLGTRRLERTSAGRGADVPLRDRIQLFLRNRHFFVLLLAKVTFFTGVSMLTASGAFFTQYVLGASDRLIALFYLCFFVCVVLSQPLWLTTGKRLSKHSVFIALCILLAGVNLTWLLATPEEARLYFILRAGLIGGCFGGIIVMGQSMLPDTIEYDRNRSGLNREGMFAGMFSFAEKSSTALGIALVGLILGVMGYQESSDAVVLEQPASAITAIHLCFAVAPALLTVTSACVMCCYRLSHATLVESRTQGAMR